MARCNMAKLVDGHSLDELVLMEHEACQRSNAKRADEIRWAITHKLRAIKIARGEKINDEGYSGRNSNKR